MFLNGHDFSDDKENSVIQQFIDNMPIFIGAKSLTCEYLMGNNFFATRAGLPNSQVLKGIYDAELNCRIKQIAHILTAEDTLVMQHNRTLTILVYGFYANNKAILLYGKKYPILDKKGAILGCGFCSNDVTTSPLINLTPVLSLRNTAHGTRQVGDQFSYIITENIPEYELSNRQLECLFHLLRGRSANDIAITLNISKRTVETHIDAIKYKLGCDTKPQLIEKALEAGVLNYIPPGLIHKAL